MVRKGARENTCELSDELVTYSNEKKYIQHFQFYLKQSRIIHEKVHKSE